MEWYISSFLGNPFIFRESLLRESLPLKMDEIIPVIPSVRIAHLQPPSEWWEWRRIVSEQDVPRWKNKSLIMFFFSSPSFTTKSLLFWRFFGGLYEMKFRSIIPKTMNISRKTIQKIMAGQPPLPYPPRNKASQRGKSKSQRFFCFGTWFYFEVVV